MFAQSFLEYGTLGGGIRVAVEKVTNEVQLWIHETSPTTWVVVALILLVVLPWWRRRK